MSTKPNTLGKGWPNLMVGMHRELGNGASIRSNRGFLCRVELDTPLTKDDADRLNSALAANQLDAAASVIVDARNAQGMELHRDLIKAAIKTSSKPADGNETRFTFKIAVEGMVDHGKEPYMAKSVRFVMDVPVNALPRELTPGRIEAAVRMALGTNPRARRIRVAFEQAH